MSKRGPSKHEFIEQLSELSGITPPLTKQVMDTLYEWIIRDVKESEDHSFYIPGFGTFYKAKHKGHPLNLKLENSASEIKDYETFKFRAAPSLKDRVLKADKKAKTKKKK